MTQKKTKSVSSNRRRNLANTEAPKIQGQQKKKKKSIVDREKTIFFNQIIISNRENVTQKFNQINNGEEAIEKINLSICQQKKKKESVPPYQICKAKSFMEPSNDNTDQMDADQVMGIHFHEEIMVEILNWLPVQSLLLFKCVSKCWKALIADPYFKMKHHIHTKNDQNSQKFLCSQMYFGKDGMCNFNCSSLSMVQVVEDERKLDFPSSCKPRNSRIYGSCDGLVLLLVLSDRLGKHLWLWNPSTRESTVLPDPESPLVNCACGLGYDVTSDDYKILAINLNDDDKLSHNVSLEVLALKSGSWRRFGYPTGIQRVSGFRNCGMDYLPFVHGAFHWLGTWSTSRSIYYTILSFNISNEVYGKIPLSKHIFDRYYSAYYFKDQGVSVLGGMLCFYCTSNNMPEHEGTFKLRVMKDYGIKDSWTQLITIRGTNLFYSARPKYMFADGAVLLLCQRIGCLGSALITSREPSGLWPKNLTYKQGIVYTES